MRSRLSLLVFLSAALLLLASCAGAAPSRTIEVAMVDNAFDPTAISVAKRETVTFKFTNNGKVDHDAFIGDAAAQEEHGETMSSEDHHMHGGDDLVLEPGKSGELTHTFEEPGEVILGCHQPGHYEAGMKAVITAS